MKCIPILSSIGFLCLAGCETMNQPISSGDFDPLGPPGGNIGPSAASSSGPGYTAGQFVRAAIPNTAFYKKRPSGDGDADKLLKQGTSMKVISKSGSYLKVELDSGEIGFVPTVMVEDPSAAPAAATTMPGEYQVYPPLTGDLGGPLPIIDPAGLPPEGAIPTVIDPEAPSVIQPVPAPTTPGADSFATPVEPSAQTPPAPSGSVPLPPNQEDLKAMEEKAKQKTGQ